MAERYDIKDQYGNKVGEVREVIDPIQTGAQGAAAGAGSIIGELLVALFSAPKAVKLTLLSIAVIASLVICAVVKSDKDNRRYEEQARTQVELQAALAPHVLKVSHTNALLNQNGNLTVSLIEIDIIDSNRKEVDSVGRPTGGITTTRLAQLVINYANSGADPIPLECDAGTENNWLALDNGKVLNLVNQECATHANQHVVVPARGSMAAVTSTAAESIGSHIFALHWYGATVSNLVLPSYR